MIWDRRHFMCSCGCGFGAMDAEIVNMLDIVCDHFSISPERISIHCACRCLDKNREIGSSDTSYHIRGMAIDFHVVGVEHEIVYKYLCDRYQNTNGIILYSWGVHFDVGQGGHAVNNRPYRKG